jgi:hypothetical protein
LNAINQEIKKVEEFSGSLTAKFVDRIACRRGCDSCCTHIGVMPVEDFQGMESLPGDAVLNLETLNTVLATINALFRKELGEAAVDMPERLTIAEALLLEIDSACSRRDVT